jgi:uncharacterized protein
MHIFLTGASAGIGEGLARELARAGHSLRLVARRRDRLDALAAELGVPCHVVAADLNDPEAAVALLGPAEAALGPIDVLINNAGQQVIGHSHLVPFADTRRVIELNLLTPLALTQAVLPAMIARRSGTIVDIASMAALAPTPRMLSYNAAKCGMAGASEALRGELMGSGVHVVTVYPGIIDTEMAAHALVAIESSWLLRMQPRGTTAGLASRIHHAIQHKKDRVIYPLPNALARWFPTITRWLMDRMTPPLAANQANGA